MRTIPTPTAADAAAAYRLWWEQHGSDWPPDHHVPLTAWSTIVYAESIAFRKQRGGYLLALQHSWLLACIEREFPDMHLQDTVGGIIVDIDRDRWPELSEAAEAAANDFAAFHAEGNHRWRLDMIPPTRRDDSWGDEYDASNLRLDELRTRAKGTRRTYQQARRAAWGDSGVPPRDGEAPKATKPRGPQAKAIQPRNRGTVTACWFCTPTDGHHEPDCMMGQIDEALA